MISGLINDVAQRLITANKYEQRQHLRSSIERLNLPEQATVLDFGCGTGLFCPTIQNLGCRYVGYDIASSLIDYGAKLYPKAQFTVNKQEIEQFGPFDLVVANCCFHHIPSEVAAVELAWLNRNLSRNGKLLFIDILAPEGHIPFLRKQFLKLERGMFLRKNVHYRELVEQVYEIEQSWNFRSHVLSIPGPINPMFNDLTVMICRKQMQQSWQECN